MSAKMNKESKAKKLTFKRVGKSEKKKEVNWRQQLV